MITKNIKDASQLKAKLPNVLRDLKKRLGSSIGVKWKLTFAEKTPFSLHFNMSRHSNPKDTIKVDLLPTFEANVEGNNGMYLFKRKGCNIAFTHLSLVMCSKPLTIDKIRLDKRPELMVASSKISEKWEYLLTRVSRSYKMATALAWVHLAFFARVFLLSHLVFFFLLPFCPHYIAWFQAI